MHNKDWPKITVQESRRTAVSGVSAGRMVNCKASKSYGVPETTLAARVKTDRRYIWNVRSDNPPKAGVN
jgi:hypothetical protein